MVKFLLSACLVICALGAFGQAIGDYQTFQSGPWGSVNTWSRWNGTAWINPAPVAPTSAVGVIQILSGHTVNVAASVITDQTTVKNGGTLTIDPTFTLSFNGGVGDELTTEANTILNVNGTMTVALGRTVRISGRVNNAGTITGSATLLFFNAGSNYYHLFDGTTASVIPIANWNDASTMHIVGYTNGGSTLPTNIDFLKNTFGHFVWNCPNQDADVFLDGSIKSTKGSFRVIDTGGGILWYNAGGGANTSFTVGNDPTDSLAVSGGVFAIFSGGVTGGVIDVRGNFAVTGGYVQVADDQDLSLTVEKDFVLDGGAIIDFAATTAVTTFNLNGNFNQTGGDTFVNGGLSNLTFTGGGTEQIFTSAFVPTGAFNYVIPNGAVVKIPDGSYLGGNGDFTLTGTLRVQSLSGTGPFSTSGNVQNLGARNFNSGSTIEFKGSAAQFLGASYPSGTAGVNLKITNPSGVTLAATSTTIGGDLTLTSGVTGGNLVLGSRTLVLAGDFIPNDHFLTVTSSSSISITTPGTTFTGPLALSGSSLNNLTLNRSGITFAAPTSLTIVGTFANTAGTLDFSGAKTLTLNGAYTGGGTFAADASSTLIVGGSGTITGSLPISGTIGSFTLNRATTVNITAIIATRLRILQGTLGGSITMNSAGGSTLERGGGTFLASLSVPPLGYNLEYSNASLVTTSNEVDSPIINFTMSGSGGVTLNEPLDINGVLWIQNGALTSGTFPISLAGNFKSDGGNTVFTGSTFTFDGNTTLSGATNINFANIFIASTGTLNLGSVTCNISGNLTHTAGGTMTAGTSSVRFNGNTTLTSDASNIPRFNNLQINASSSLSLVCSGNCALEPAQFSIEVAGNWNSNTTSSTFNPGAATGNLSSRVIFTGASQNLSMLSTHSFSTFEMSGSSSVTLTQALQIQNDLVIGTGTTLSTGSGNQAISLGDDFISNGTFVPNQSTFVFNGSSNQSVNQVSGTANTTSFYNLVINKGGGNFTIQKSVNLLNFMLINSATTVSFDNFGGAGVFTLVSTPLTTAQISPIQSPADPTLISGKVTVQRYMGAEGTTYRYISTPVLNPTAADLQGEISVTGPFTGTSYPCTGCTNAQSMFVYNEALPGSINSRYTAFPVSNNTETMTPGKGYSVFVRASTPITWNLRAPINTGTQALTVSNSNDGWNLVGNPFPAPLDWLLADGATAWTRTNIDPTIYIWDNTINNYATYNKSTLSGTNGGSRYIAMGQAFWVHASGAPTLTTREGSKAATIVQPTFFRENGPIDMLRITVAANANHQDQVLLHFNINGATDNYDPSLDSYKFPNDTLMSLYSVTADNKRMAISALGSSTGSCSNEIKVGLANVKVGHFSLSFDGMDSFSNPATVYLLDKFLGTSFNVTNSGNYEFDVTSDSASYGDNRFRVLFSPTDINTNLSTLADDVCPNSDGKINLFSSQNGVNYFAMIGGKTVSPVVSGNNQNIALSIPKDILIQGQNAVTIMAQAGGCEAIPFSKKISFKTVTLGNAEIGLDGQAFVSNYDDGNQWYLNGQKIEGATDKYFVPSQNGLYKLEVSQGQCSISAEREMDSIEISDAIITYPNPTSGVFTVRVLSELPVNGTLFNSLGAQVGLSKNLEETSKNEWTGQFDLSSNASGMYLIKIQQGNNIQSKKILKK